MSTEPSTQPRTSAPKRGLNGALVRAWGGKDLRLQVLERQDVTADFVRLRADLDGLLARDEVYPTYWLRLWFTTAAGRSHQRAYTVVDPRPADGSAWLEFFLHDGAASDWARAARPGDQIDATVLNGRNPVVEEPAHLLLVGDGCAYPAIADLLRRRPEIPATVLLEQADEAESVWALFEERENLSVRRVEADGSIVEAATAAARSAPTGTVTVVALEGVPTRALSKALRSEVGLSKKQLHALAYWKRR